MRRIKITVCVPTYNRPKDLENLIQSYLSINYKNSTLLIIDDLGSKRTEPLVKKYKKIDKRIKYRKNIKNLGFSANLRKGIRLVDKGIIIFMGDDDIFIDDDILNYFENAFKHKSVMMAKCAQIIFKNGKLNQVYDFPNKKRTYSTYKKGNPKVINLWFESLSITGLAFRVNKNLKKFITKSNTLYPQVELAGKVLQTGDSIEINKYLVGVQSHSNQLNPIFYNLNSDKMNIFDDWLSIYDRISENAEKRFINRKAFINKLTNFLPVFFPYTTLNNGRKKTFDIVKKCLGSNPSIVFSPFNLLVISASLFLPNIFLKNLIEWYKSIKLNNTLNNFEMIKINERLNRFYE